MLGSDHAATTCWTAWRIMTMAIWPAGSFRKHEKWSTIRTQNMQKLAQDESMVKEEGGIARVGGQRIREG